MGAVWPTKFSFSHSFLRHVADIGFKFSCAERRLDGRAHGRIIYHVEIAGAQFTFLGISNLLPEGQQQDRIIATEWDALACLFLGRPTEQELLTTEAQLPNVLRGRATPGSVVWSRANRSVRLFEHVVERLTKGRQPDPHLLNQVGYLIRTTSFSANGRNGLVDFTHLGEASNPLCAPYHVQMLACYLWREFGCDVAEHCAKLRNPDAVSLSGDVRRFLGVGNSSGIGLVPFVVRHPRLVHTWVASRELALRDMRRWRPRPDDSTIDDLRRQMRDAVDYFRAEPRGDVDEFTAGPALAADLTRADQFLRTATEASDEYVFASLIDWSALNLTIEGQELLNSLILEVHNSGKIEPAGAAIEETLSFPPHMRVETLLRLIYERFDWTLRYREEALQRREFFWYLSEENMEPRRGVRGVDPGEQYALPVDFMGRLSELIDSLQAARSDISLGRFLVDNPDMRFMVSWAYTLAQEDYAVARADLLDKEFAPLKLMRFQLALYGMLKFRPRSKTWLRATILQGAGLPNELAAGHPGDGLLPRLPAAS